MQYTAPPPFQPLRETPPPSRAGERAASDTDGRQGTADDGRRPAQQPTDTHGVSGARSAAAAGERLSSAAEEVHVAFRRHGDSRDFLVLSVSGDGRVRVHGNVTWFDFRFTPHSETMQGPVSFQDDPQEWARSLPAAYRDTQLNVYLCADPDVRRLNPSYTPPEPEFTLEDPLDQDQPPAGAPNRDQARPRSRRFRWR